MIGGMLHAEWAGCPQPPLRTTENLMPSVNKLTDTAIRKAKADSRPVRLFDGGGLYLEVSVTGAKLWRWKYRYGGKEKRLSLGIYPATGLKDARERCLEARGLLSAGADPGIAKKARRDAATSIERDSFEAVAREWHSTIHASQVSEGHSARTLIRFEKDVFPWIGSVHIGQIAAPQLLELLRRVEARGAIETAHRIKDSCSQVFRFGIASGRCKRDPAADLRDALRPVSTRHMPALTEPKAVGQLLRAIHGYTGLPPTRAALRLAPLVFQRPGNLRAMEWSEVDLTTGTWTIPAAKMKRRVNDKINGEAHIVPLSAQAVEILEELKPLTGHGRYVFPSVRGGDRPMSDMTLNAALQRMGFDTSKDMTTHGFRAMARTMLAERLDMPEAVIEAQLAHAVPDSLGRSYNRTKFEEQRRALMQAWADYLDSLRQGAAVLPLQA